MERTHEHIPMSDPAPSVSRVAIGLLAITAVATAVVIALAATSWVGRPFPGFFVLDNGVIASIGRPSWPVARTSIYQHVLTSVDGRPVHDGAAAYDRIATRPAGTTFVYGVDGANGERQVTAPSRLFSVSDYWVIFGGYVLTGLLYLVVALVGVWVVADPQLSRVLLALGGAGGAYALSAVGIYGADGPLRIHAFAEAVFAAPLVSFALVFPTTIARVTRPGTAIAWWLSLAIAVPYQLLLDDAGAYSALHGASELYIGAAGVAVVVRLIFAVMSDVRASSPVVQTALAGAMLGLGAPAMIFILSGVTGGRLPVNTCTVTAFLFPLCLLYGLLRERRAPVPAPAAVTAAE